MRILFTGGGTAGHILPALEVVKELQKENHEFLWIGSVNGMEKELVTRMGIPFQTVASGKLRRYFSFKNIGDMLRVPIGIFQAESRIRKFKPHVVFSKGGYVSFPVVVGAWMQNVPIVIHESDIVPGLANSQLSWFATRVALTFPDREKRFAADKTLLTGMPIRSEVVRGDRERGRTFAKIADEKPMLLIMGGSQGAKVLNDAVSLILPELLQKFAVVHLCGKHQYEELTEQHAEQITQGSYRLFAYVYDEMPDLLAASDVVVSRAGATSIFEIAALGKRNLLIPLSESANNHQQENAEYFQELGISRILLEKNLEPHILYENIMKLLFEVRESDIAESAKKIIQPDAAQKMVGMIKELANAGHWKLK